jgi:hypothetical protein
VAPEVVVALIAGGAAFAVSLASFPLHYWISQRARRVQTQDLMGRYRDPLLPSSTSEPERLTSVQVDHASRLA